MAAPLEKFQEDLSGEAPRTVSAGKLDRNFRRCMPAPRGMAALFKLNTSEDGWWFELPPPPGGTAVLGFSGGALTWILTEECEEA
jgi:hypothetical protein